VTVTEQRGDLEHRGTSEVEVLIREAREHRRRRWAVRCAIVLLAVVVVGALLAATTVGRGTTSGRTPSLPRSGSGVTSASVPVNLDILSGLLQVRVSVTHGDRGGSTQLAGPGVRAPVAFPRRGYVLAVGVGGYESVSYNLQAIFYSWDGSQGSNPVPASNPADVWLSDPAGRIGEAEEFAGDGNAVGPPVGIPPQSVVVGQSGANLVLVGPPNGQPLLLWSPVYQSVVATLGPFDQQVVTPNFVAWTDGNTLNVDNSAGAKLSTASGPSGDWATALAVNPNGTKIAVVWAPRPGSAGARTRAVMVADSRLGLVDVVSGGHRLIAGSRGVVGPLAWAPDGEHLYVGRAVSDATSVKIATYDVVSRAFSMVNLPRVTIPYFFDQATGALIAWTNSGG
jgi:hypothetical protein